MTKINSKKHITKTGVVKSNPPTSLSSKLRQFSGTEGYTRGYMGVLMTDGVVFLANQGASWLVSDVSVIVKMQPKVRNESFVSITAVSKDKKAVVTYTDGNDNKLFTQKYQYTDLEEGEYKLFYTDGVLMLANEY